jgi:putative ATPase
MPIDQPELFAAAARDPAAAKDDAPLAERMRPRSLDEVVGQQRALGRGTPLREALEGGELPSVLLWGPPGVGKTSLARLLADRGGARFEALSAVLAGVADVRKIVEAARRRRERAERTVLFVDEIHRFHKGQQDALLPHVEDGTLTLVGATTENPSFALNAALLSRCVLVVLEPLDAAALDALAGRALSAARGLGGLGVRLDDAARSALVAAADGDARRLLGMLEAGAHVAMRRAARDPEVAPVIAVEDVARAAGAPVTRYDRDGDEHHHVVSAFIKSMRGSDPDAAVYYLARMLESGEDPRFVARRMVVFASEDVGNADPRALGIAVAAAQAHELVGMPESRIPLAHAATYLACAPKSKAAYLAIGGAIERVRAFGTRPVPDHLRNASSSVAKALGWGQAYRDPHAEGGWVPERYLPDGVDDAPLYEPTSNGYERHLRERLQTWRSLRRQQAPASRAEATGDADEDPAAS